MTCICPARCVTRMSMVFASPEGGDTRSVICCGVLLAGGAGVISTDGADVLTAALVVELFEADGVIVVAAIATGAVFVAAA